MNRPIRSAAWVVVLVALAAAAILPGAAASAQDVSEAGERADGRVLIIAAPRLTWSEVAESRPPNLMRLLDMSAVASASIRTAGSTTRPGDAYLTIGAGNRMATTGDVDGTVVERTEPIVEGDPTAVFERTTGYTPAGPILAIGKPQLDAFNEDEYFFGAEAGSLAGALRSVDRSVAVIGNADRKFGMPGFRHVGLAAMDRRGQVSDGLVSSVLLRAEDAAAFGLSIDPVVFGQVFDRVWSTSDVVIAELSDLERAEAARRDATDEQGDRQYRRALASSDVLVGDMLESVDWAEDTVIVVAPTPPLEENQLTVFSIAGPGIRTGWATSSTTRRDGYVTLTDIAPTVLDGFDVDVPSAMTDTRISAHRSDDTLDSRIDVMIDRNQRAIARDRVFGPITVAFIVALVSGIVLAMLSLARLPRLSAWVRAIALVVLATPPATFLVGLVPIASSGALVAAVAGGAVLLAAVAALTRRVDPGLPPLALLVVLWLVLAADIATGGNLQINTVFGYSPIVAGRFAGFGNQAFSMISLAALLVGSVFVERRTAGRARASTATLVAVAVWFLLTIVLDGHPAMGSDVGGVLAFVPAATVALLMFGEVRIRPRLVALIGGGTVAVLSAFAALDLARDAEDRTHLGRFAAKVFDGDAGEIIQRKIAANLRVLTSVWAWVIPVALVYFVYLTWRPNRTLQRFHCEHPQFRAFGVSALTLGVLAMGLNDSGVSLPAMMLALVAAFVSYHVLDLEPSEATEPSEVTA